MPKRSQTERAVYAVKRRKEDYEAKRFNSPLRIFLERKYPRILEEFTELYNFFDYVNPGRKDLTKTATFKQWMAENPAPLRNVLPSTKASASPSETDTFSSLSTMVSASPSETDTFSSSSTMISASPSETDTFSSLSTMVSASPSETDTFSSSSTMVSVSPSETDTFSSLSTMVSASEANTNTSLSTSVSPSEVDTISEIIDELFGPNGIPDEDLPTSNEDDEGIELNHFDELAFDIEPFDFLLETN